MTTHLLARIGPERFAFALDRVREALDAPALHDPPRRPPGMLGTLHYRGQTLPVWDGAHAFGIARDAGEGTALVLDDAGCRVALLVGDALDVIDIAPEGMRPAPGGAGGSGGAGLLAGVARDADGLVGVVRVDMLVARLVSWGAGREA